MKRFLGILTIASCLLFVTSCKDDSRTVISGEITSVAITTFPMTDASGDAWDLDLLGFENPDLEVRFNRGGAISNDYLVGGERYDDVTSPGNYVFEDFNAAWSLDMLTDDYTIGLYDFDLLGSDEMSTFTFSPSTYTGNAPSNFELTSGDATVTVNVTWTFED